MEEIVKKAKATITEEVERAGYQVRRILLFGSRARGDARPDSDWDFYIVVEQDIPLSVREELASQICWKLARQGIFADIFLQSELVVQTQASDVGRLTYYVLKEGVVI
jgi:predicted nucleotidyltransferase